MPPAAEDMTIDDLKAACEALVCRILPSPFVSSPGPEGIFNHVNFSMRSLNEVDCAPSVHWAFKPTCAHAQAAGKKIMQYCLENMGARQYRCFQLTNQAISNSSRTKAAFDDLEDRELDAGFDYLIKNGPRSGSDLRQLRWQTKELRRKESPVYNWPAGVVDKALRTLASDGALARKEFDWPLPLTSTFFKRWVLDILENVWDFDHSAFVLLGEPGAGKSPLGRSVLMAQCRRNAQSFEGDQRPCIRCSPEIDFFRGEQGTVTMGDFLDDPSTSDLSIKALKSLLDVGLYESMSWARWGAVKWVQNQPRALAANSYDCDIQEGDDFTTLFKFEDFKKMIRPAITRETTSADIDALFKRAAFIVNTKRFVYFRKAGVNDDKVPRRFAESADYLTEEGGKWYGKFKEHRKELPPNFEEEVRKEQAWLDLVHKKLSEKRDPKFKQRQQVRQLFRGPADEETCLEQMDKADSSRVAIKREIEEQKQTEVFKRARTWSHDLTATRTVIELGSSQENEADTRDADIPVDYEEEIPAEHEEEEEEDFEEDPFKFGNLGGTEVSRRDRMKWKRTLKEIMCADDEKILKILAEAVDSFDTAALRRKHLQGKSIILHTDSARSYKLKIDGVVHDSVVHKKKLVIKNGKRSWKPPTYVKVVSHKLPGGKRLSVKAGTQIIDRAWRFIKDRLKANQNVKAGSVILRAQIRSAQYEYWQKGKDMWSCTGDLMSWYMSRIM
ncbi:unnamed protein product [Effrenium voratum]|nr:unnamed protein product [Effrenium voratum]